MEANQHAVHACALHGGHGMSLNTSPPNTDHTRLPGRKPHAGSLRAGSPQARPRPLLPCARPVRPLTQPGRHASLSAGGHGRGARAWWWVGGGGNAPGRGGKAWPVRRPSAPGGDCARRSSRSAPGSALVAPSRGCECNRRACSSAGPAGQEGLGMLAGQLRIWRSAAGLARGGGPGSTCRRIGRCAEGSCTRTGPKGSRQYRVKRNEANVLHLLRLAATIWGISWCRPMPR